MVAAGCTAVSTRLADPFRESRSKLFRQIDRTADDSRTVVDEGLSFVLTHPRTRDT